MTSELLRETIELRYKSYIEAHFNMTEFKDSWFELSIHRRYQTVRVILVPVVMVKGLADIALTARGNTEQRALEIMLEKVKELRDENN